MTVALVTDSTADLPPALAAERGLTVVPLTVTVGGRSYLDGVEITPDEFYARQAEAGGIATTSQPSPGRFAEVYAALLREHEHVVSVHISSRLSGTFASAVQGADLVEAGRVTVVDSRLVSMPLGLVVLAAGEVARQGSTAADVVRTVERLAPATRVYFVVASLEQLRRGGRIGRASALVGSVLQVKPVLTIDDGQVTPLERVRTLDRAMSRVVELVRDVDNGQGICAIVGHAGAPEAAGRVASELAGVADTLLVQPLGPVVGAHAGPGTVGVGVYPAELARLGLGGLSRAGAR